VILYTVDEAATGVVKVMVKVPELLATDAPLPPTPIWKFPALLYTTALFVEVLKIDSGELPEFPYALIVKSTPSQVDGISETVIDFR
jgi:hypothetical protein